MDPTSGNMNVPRYRPKDEAESVKRTSELSDEVLFKLPPPCKECPICFLPIISSITSTYQACCGKFLCNGCIYASGKVAGYDVTKCPCPFCRQPVPQDNEVLKLLRKRVKAKDVNAMHTLACQYYYGGSGATRDVDKALGIFLSATKLGSIESHFALGNIYRQGQIVTKDMPKAIKHYEIAAMGGSDNARHSLGSIECEAGNFHRAMRHYMISASAGHDPSLMSIRKGFECGFVTKDDYAKALRAHKDAQDEAKSESRDFIAAINARSLQAVHDPARKAHMLCSGFLHRK